MEKKATDSLLADHKMIRKLLADFDFDNPRFNEMAKTLHRVVLGHAWFEDEIFIPVLRQKPLFQKSLLDEINTEHKDIDQLLHVVRKVDLKLTDERDAARLQLVTLLRTHFEKEEDAMFPLAEKVLDAEGLNKIGREMKARQAEIRSLLKD